MTVIHVGFLKTASTLLQKQLFPNHPAMNFFNQIRHGGHSDMEEDPVYSELVRLAHEGNETYDPSKLKAMFKSFVEHADGEVVISDEAFTSYDGNIGLKAERLKDVFGEVKVLFVLRNQFSSMRSYQKQNGIKTHLIPGPLDRVDWEQRLWYQMLPGHLHWKYLSMLHYNEIIGYYEKLFGRENIHVLLYETLKSDLTEFSRQLAAIFSIDADEVRSLLQSKGENVGPKQAYRRAFKFVPHILLKKKDPQNFEAYEARVREMFEVGNKLLMDRYDLPLKSYGYPVA